MPFSVSPSVSFFPMAATVELSVGDSVVPTFDIPSVVVCCFSVVVSFPPGDSEDVSTFPVSPALVLALCGLSLFPLFDFGSEVEYVDLIEVNTRKNAIRRKKPGRPLLFRGLPSDVAFA